MKVGIMIGEDVRAGQQKSAMFNANSQVSSFSFCVLACFLAFDCGIGKEQEGRIIQVRRCLVSTLEDVDRHQKGRRVWISQHLSA